jgi:hypothetical protein
MEHLKQIAAVGAAFARLAADGVESQLTRTLSGASRFRRQLRASGALAAIEEKKNTLATEPSLSR